MKSIKDLRESYNLITEKEEHDMNKLTQLVRAGLFDAKKLSALKRAMEKPADKMTAQEKRMLINLLDALMSEVLSDKQVYRKIKQDVMMREAVVVDTKDYLSKIDPRVKRYGYSQKEAPSVLLLKRKAIRVFPDGQKVALYYAQAIDKYVSIPFSEIGISEELELNELSLGQLGGIISGITNFISGARGSSTNNSSSSSDDVAKELKSLEREKTKLSVGGPKDKDDDNRPNAVRSRTERLARMANQAMAKDVRENFQNKLEVLREAKAKRKWWDRDDPEGGGYGGPTRVMGGGDVMPRGYAQEILRGQGSETISGARAKYFARRFSGSTKVEPKPSGPSKRPRLPPVRRRRDRDPDPRDPGRYTPAQPRPQRKPTSPNREDKPIEQPKPTTPKPVEPKPSGPPKRFAPPKVKPIEVEPPKITPIPPDRKEPDVKPAPKKPTTPAREEPAYKPKPAAKPDFPGAFPAAKPAGKPSIAPTQQPSSQPTPLQQPKDQPWKDAAKWAQTQGQPAAQPQRKNKDEEGTKKREPKDQKKKRGLVLPKLALALSDPGAKALSAIAPGLKLAISGPKREGDPDAIRSRQASIERAALKAQASIKESVNLDGNVFELNNRAAEKVTALYESLNKKNKKKMVEMMSESAESLEKVISFAVRQ